MLDYRTYIQPPQAVPDAMQDRALAGIRSPSPYAGAYGKNHADVIRAISGRYADDYSRAAKRANVDHDVATNAARSQAALAGLQQQAQSQQNQRQLAGQKMDMMFGTMNSLLGGLFQ